MQLEINTIFKSRDLINIFMDYDFVEDDAGNLIEVFPKIVHLLKDNSYFKLSKEQLKFDELPGYCPLSVHYGDYAIMTVYCHKDYDKTLESSPLNVLILEYTLFFQDRMYRLIAKGEAKRMIDIDFGKHEHKKKSIKLIKKSHKNNAKVLGQ